VAKPTMTKSTKIPAQQGETTPQPWQGPWDRVAKFLVVQLGMAIILVLVWLIVTRH
jgi:hypothetical protein